MLFDQAERLKDVPELQAKIKSLKEKNKENWWNRKVF